VLSGLLAVKAISPIIGQSFEMGDRHDNDFIVSAAIYESVRKMIQKPITKLAPNNLTEDWLLHNPGRSCLRILYEPST
jgi:hypothetical protein